MTGAKRLTSLCFVLFAVVVWAPALRAQASAELGKTLFMRRSCSGCHAIGKGGHMAGPDLKGVTQRRSPEWLKSWLKSPDTMVMSDSTAKALFKEYHQVKMPNLKLSDEEVAALIAYMDQASNEGGQASAAPAKAPSKSSKKS